MTWLPLTRETAAATQAHIESILGLSRKTFNASAFLAQGNSAAFPEMTPAERKGALGEILDPHGLWPRLADRAGTERKTVEQELSSVAVQIADREQRVAFLPDYQQQLQRFTAAEAAARAALAEAETALEQAQAAVAANAAAAERIRTLTLQRDHADAAHTQACDRLKAAKHATGILPEAQEHLDTLTAAAARVPELEQQLDEQRRQLAEAQAARERKEQAVQHAERLARAAAQASEAATTVAEERERISARLATLITSADGHEKCQLCQQTLGTEAREASIVALHAELAQRDAAIVEAGPAALTAAQAANEAHAAAAAIEVTYLAALPDIETPLQQARSAASGLPAAEQNVRALTEQASALTDCDAAVSDAGATLAAANAALAAAAQGVQDDAQLHRAVVGTRETVATRRSTLETSQADVIRTRQLVEQLQQAVAELVALRATVANGNDRLDLLRLAERAYGRDGIPVLIAENVIPVIEAEANRILDRLPTSDGTVMRVELRTQRALKTAEHLRETLDILVSDLDTTRAFETFSGGEAFRVSFALRWALAKLLANRRGAESRVLVIDEPDGLDAAGMDALAAILREEAATFSRILVVSHNPLLASAFEQCIEIEKTGGVSRIVSGVTAEAVAA